MVQVIVAVGMAVVIWAELINPFFSGAVRIQADRGQRVISAGGLALNSLVSILPAVVIALPITVYRTMIEDRMLRDELAGYAEYAAKVRYRPIPGVW